MHVESRAWVENCEAVFGPHRRILDVGGRDVNGSNRASFLDYDEFVSVDRLAGPGVDVVADVIPWTEGHPPWFDLVLISNVIEHERRWRRVIAAARTVLIPGGLLVVAGPGPEFTRHSAIDGGPVRSGEWYEAPTRRKLDNALRRAGFEVYGISDVPPDLNAWAIR